MIRGQKKHINLFNINFWPPPQTPDFGPPEKFYVPHFLGKDAKKGTHISFWGGFLGQKGGSTRAIFGHKRLVYLLFALNDGTRFMAFAGKSAKNNENQRKAAKNCAQIS